MERKGCYYVDYNGFGRGCKTFARIKKHAQLLWRAGAGLCSTQNAVARSMCGVAEKAWRQAYNRSADTLGCIDAATAWLGEMSGKAGGALRRVSACAIDAATGR
eukprot:1464589-Pleurochrysis_carterae.AAC.2